MNKDGQDPVLLYVHLSWSQRGLPIRYNITMRMRKKKWVKPFLEEENRYLLRDTEKIKSDRPLYLEIGMGMGDFITASARDHKDISYIGLEKDETCVARAIKKAEEYKLDNLRIILVNADQLEEYFDEKSIDRIYLHFSDPWPKKAHHKRRLTYPSFLKIYKKVLKDEGDSIFKTDNEDFFRVSLDYFKEAQLIVHDISTDYHKEPHNEPLTAYEAKFKDTGKPINYARLTKM